MTDLGSSTSEGVQASARPDLPPFPVLRGRARPVAQDRWERLVSSVEVPAPIDEVWAALTDPDRPVHWFARACSGWASVGASSTLDFDDGEFFWCLTDAVEPPADGRARLSYRWRWVGVGPSASVVWLLESVGESTSVVVVESNANGPADWRSWNGMGWPGILDQLSDHVTTGRDARWPWRRMGPFVQIELPVSAFEAWAALTATPALQFWMGRNRGSLSVDDPMEFTLGDASGSATLHVKEHIEANQRFPSFLPSLAFTLRRAGWPGDLQGNLWVEPAGLGASLAQVWHAGWECFGGPVTAPHDRVLMTRFWIDAFNRLAMLVGGRSGGAPEGVAAGPHSWSF